MSTSPDRVSPNQTKPKELNGREIGGSGVSTTSLRRLGGVSCVLDSDLGWRWWEWGFPFDGSVYHSNKRETTKLCYKPFLNSFTCIILFKLEVNILWVQMTTENFRTESNTKYVRLRYNLLYRSGVEFFLLTTKVSGCRK